MATNEERRAMANRLLDCSAAIIAGFGTKGFRGDILDAIGCHGADAVTAYTKLANLIYFGLTGANGEVNEAKVDRGALLALADSMERRADDFDATVGDVPMVHAGYLTEYACRIREALGMEP